LASCMNVFQNSLEGLEESLTKESTKSLVVSKLEMRVSGNKGEITDSQTYNRIVRLTHSSCLAIMSNEYGGVPISSDVQLIIKHVLE